MNSLSASSDVTEDLISETQDVDDLDSSSSRSTGKRNFKSEVWEYFDKVVWTKEQKTARCTFLNCRHKPFSCGTGGTTRPLWCHLETSHFTVYVTTEEYNRKKQNVQKECGSIKEMLKQVRFLFFYYF